MDLIKSLSGFLLVFVLISPVSAIANTSVTSHIDNSGTTPFSIWATAALIGLVLLLITLRSRSLTTELEADAIISVIAWVPIGFTSVTSFAVDRIVGTYIVVGSTTDILENHIIYHFEVIGILYGILLFIAIINTVRIISLHKALQLQGETSA